MLKSESADEFDRTRIAGLNVGLQAVKPVLPKRKRNDLAKAATHIALARKRKHRRVAKKATLKRPADDSANVDERCDLATVGHYEVADTAARLEALKILPEERRSVGRVGPGTMKPPAPTHSCKEVALMLPLGRD